MKTNGDDRWEFNRSDKDSVHLMLKKKERGSYQTSLP